MIKLQFGTRIVNMGHWPAIYVGREIYFPTPRPIEKGDIFSISRMYRVEDVKRLNGGVDLYTVTGKEYENERSHQHVRK